MSALTEKPRKIALSKPKAAASVVAGLPQVNLLPPEVRSARGLASIKRWLVLALLVTLALCALLYAVNVAASRSADDDLVAAQNETSRLTLEQAKYAELPRVQEQLKLIQSTRTTAMSTDVLWKSYLDAIAAVLPEGVSLDVLSMTGATPMTPTAPSANDPAASSVGSILITARSLTMPDTAALIAALDSVPGLGNAWLTTAVVAADPDHGVYYKIDGSVQVEPSAYSHRFDPADDSDGGK